MIKKLLRLVTTSNDLGTFTTSYLGETTAPTAEHLQGLLRPLTAYHYENNRQDRRLAAIDHPRKALSYAYQSSPYTIDAIDEQGRNTTDWRYFYDNADRLMEAHGGLRQDFTFDYDQADNLTRMESPAGTTIMHPDQTNAIRELIQRRTGLPGPQRIRPAYDKNGNLTDDGEHHYTWDGLNHLTAIAYHGHPRWHTTLAYDGLDHLVTITEQDDKDSETQHLLWCGEAICGLTDDKGTLHTRLFQQGEWHQGQVLYYARDHLGSIRDVLGTLPPLDELINLASTDYGPYGETLDEGRGRRSDGGGAGLGKGSLPAEQGVGSDGAGLGDNASPETQDKRHAAIQSTLGYAGMFYHARSGLYLTHYRAYDPRLGRWLSRDPIWEAGGINLYGYVGGNPISRIDPFGLDWVYSQSTGQLTYVDSTGNSTNIGSAYAGHGEGANNPAMQGDANRGPLPQGTYTIDPQQNNTTGRGTRLPGSMRLTPDPSNNMNGRGGFLIHGDNSRGDRSASEGCIIMNRNIRNQVGNSGDPVLRVEP